MSSYTNDLAAYVYSKGFKPRIFNDGVYFNEGSSNQQKITMHDYIGIDYWSRTSWIGGSPTLQTFINRGHKTIYNFNSSFFYYVLRSGPQSDGRPANSFDVKEQYKNIYNNWTPGNFSGAAIADDHESISGAAIGVWCDYPNTVDEDTVHTDIAKELRSLATKSWNTDSNSILSYDEFAVLTTELGNVAAYEKGSVLPEVGEFMEGDELGKIVLKYVDEEGTSLRNDRIVYGLIDDTYAITPDPVYGYRFVSADKSVEGTFTKEEVTITLTYELYTDKAALNAAIDGAKAEADYIPVTYAEYKAALADAKTVASKEAATQAETDAALEALTEAEAQLVSLDRVALYLEVTYPIAAGGYTTSSYAEYQAALTAGTTVLYNADAAEEEAEAALNNILAKKDALAIPADDITVTANKDGYSGYVDGSWQSFPLTNMLDGNTSTKTWINGNQEVGDYFLFTFAAPVTLNSFRIQFPDNQDFIYQADVEVSADNSEWTKIGTIDNTSAPQLDITLDADGETVQYVRIRITKEDNHWSQITEVTFDYVSSPVDNSALETVILSAKDLNEADYSKASWTVLKAALENAEEVLANTNATAGEIKAAADALNASMESLQTPSEEETPKTPVTEIFRDVKDGAWYVSNVQYVYNKGLMSGSNGLFNPTNNVKRSQVIVTLYRMAGSPEVTDRAALTELVDVNPNAYYADAVCWAYNEGVITGTGDGNKYFLGSDDVKRQQLAAMFYRFAECMGYSTEESADISSMVNADKVSGYALGYVKWAVGAGLISGSQVTDANGNVSYDLKPHDTASRAQLAAILQRFCERNNL